MTANLPGQLTLFGAQSVHLGHYSRIAEAVVCVMCKASLALADTFDPCGVCPGFVSPAPSWMVLAGPETQPDALPFAAEEQAA